MFMVFHAAKGDTQTSLDHLSSIIRDHQSSSLSFHDFSFCIEKLGYKKKDILRELENCWAKMRAEGFPFNLRVANSFINVALSADERGMYQLC